MLERNFDQLSLTHLKWDKLTTQVMRILARGSCVVAAIDKYTQTTKSCGGKGTAWPLYKRERARG